MPRLRRFFAAPAIAACALVATPAVAQIRVAVEKGPNATSSAAATAAQLNDDTFFDFTATIVDASQLDSAAELAAYDVVLFGDSGSTDNDITAAMAQAVKAWAQQGHGVVSAGWVDWITVNDATRDPILDDIMPIDAYPFYYTFCGSTPSIDIAPIAHPITTGIASFTLPTSQDTEYSPNVPDAVNAQVLATVSGASCNQEVPRQTVVAGELGTGRLVYLGLVYMGGSGYNNGDLRTGPPDRLLEQAVAWASGGNVNPQPDADGDGVPDISDNCPLIPNLDQADLDKDGTGDACDGDIDGDGFTNDVDDCPLVADPGQVDTDGDGLGDVCDLDADGDGIDNGVESMLGTDPLDPDSDGDTIADGEEIGNPNAPFDTDGDKTIDALDTDSDGDGLLDAAEAGDADLKTPAVDTDGDKLPNYRDTDSDGDGLLDGTDPCPLDPTNACVGSSSSTVASSSVVSSSSSASGSSSGSGAGPTGSTTVASSSVGPGGGAGGAGGSDDGFVRDTGGCGCRTSSDEGAPGGAALAVLAAAIAFSRRRRSY